MSTLDEVNDFIFGGVRAAFGSKSKAGDSLSGELIEATREQQTDAATGEPLYWTEAGQPTTNATDTHGRANRKAMHVVAIFATDQRIDEDDDGLRRLFIRGEVKNAIAKAVRGAGVRGIELGGRIEGLQYKGKHDGRMLFGGGTWTPPEPKAGGR